jgi:alanyl-tRNA synthetase
MTILSSDLRKKYLDFFRSKNHAILESSPLVPENDPSVLFNTAGMQPLVPYLLGEKHPMGKRLADVQKCVRTGDIDDVGDNSHLTFFEMLGNWSLGDYFKEDSIRWSYEFLTSKEWLGLDPKWLAVTVFEGNEDAPADDFSASIWESLGMPTHRISRMPAKNNWWAAGATGPCGPDTEIFYWVGEGEPNPASNVKDEEDNWMEIWNNVFMEFNRLEDGSLASLPAQNVDTGMGLERTTAVLNGKKTVYHTDVFSDVLAKIKEIVGEDKYNERSARIIADHTRT